MAEYKLKYPGEKVDEGLDRAFAIAANKNLLHNWDFRNKASIVNQRGLDEYTVGGYTVDRWELSSGSLAITDQGLKFTTNDSGVSTFRQLIEFPERYAGKTITCSGEITSETGDSFQFYIRATANGVKSYGWGKGVTDGISVGTMTVPQDVTELFVSFQVPSADRQPKAHTALLKRAKLELGEISTLENDPPQDYGEELAKCQRYFYRFKMFQGAALPTAHLRTESSTSKLYAEIFTPVPLRKNANIESFSGLYISDGTKSNSSVADVSGVEPARRGSGFVGMNLTVDAAVTTWTNSYLLRGSTANNAHIDFSADL